MDFIKGREKRNTHTHTQTYKQTQTLKFLSLMVIPEFWKVFPQLEHNAEQIVGPETR